MLREKMLTQQAQTLQVDAFILQIKERSDKLMNYFLLAYYSVKLFAPHSTLYQYVLSTVFGIFMAQYIYQMHGLFEMHFVAFVGSAMLITYQNWKLQLPLVLIVVLHHAVFGYLQYLGFDKIYFTQLDY